MAEASLIRNSRSGQCESVKTVISAVVLFTLAVVYLLSTNACSVQKLPRDEIEVYQSGLDFWEKGQYEMALKVLTPFLERDSLYTPLHSIIADSYYNLGHQEKALEVLERGGRDRMSGIIDNLRFTFKALENRVELHQERVSFSQYLRDISNRFALDKSLLLALIRVGSESEQQGDGDKLGLLGLDRQAAQKIGLSPVSEDEIQALSSLEIDERLDPVKSIYYSAGYLQQFIERNRVTSRGADLINALRDFYSIGKDSTIFVDETVEQVSYYYRYYRHNRARKEETFKRFSQKNQAQGTTFSTQFSHIPDRETHDLLRAYKDSRLFIHLYLPGRQQQAYYYSNLALIADMLNDEENAEKMYKKALDLSPGNHIILFNYALFLFDKSRYTESYHYLMKIPSTAKMYESAVVVAGYCLLLLEEWQSLSVLINDLPDTVRPGYIAEEKKIPYLINLKGLYLFSIGSTEQAAETFYQAFKLRPEPIFAANYLAALYQNSFPAYSYARMDRFNKITRLYDTGYLWPVNLRHISSGWGWRPSPFGRTWEQRLRNLNFHNGIDIPGPTGTPVRASAAGEVIISESFPLGGESVFIRHEDGYITTYLHLDIRFVVEEEKVRQGQIIGLMGNTGQSTGSHLHFGMFDNKNRRANPLNYLPVY